MSTIMLVNLMQLSIVLQTKRVKREREPSRVPVKSIYKGPEEKKNLQEA